MELAEILTAAKHGLDQASEKLSEPSNDSNTQDDREQMSAIKKQKTNTEMIDGVQKELMQLKERDRDSMTDHKKKLHDDKIEKMTTYLEAKLAAEAIRQKNMQARQMTRAKSTSPPAFPLEHRIRLVQARALHDPMYLDKLHTNEKTWKAIADSFNNGFNHQGKTFDALSDSQHIEQSILQNRFTSLRSDFQTICMNAEPEQQDRYVRDNAQKHAPAAKTRLPQQQRHAWWESW
jgi:hypothetical protein